MRNRLNRSLLHKARSAAQRLYEQEHEGTSVQGENNVEDDAASAEISENPSGNIDMALNALRKATEGTKYEGNLWIVGGYVRDKLLGRPDQHLDDVDIVTELDALELAATLYAKDVSRITPVVYPRFGTAMLQMNGCAIELVTARRESYDDSSRKPSKVQPATLADDALRRDFTINTLIENLHTGERRDPTGYGLADLEAKILRTPLEPSATFADDPLRMLRAVRFAAKLRFTIEPKTWDAIVEHAAELAPPKVSAERIRDEFCKTIMTRQPSIGMELLRKSGLLSQFAPELMAMVGVTQNEFHNLPVWDHTLLALDNLVAENPTCPLDLRLGTLLHDIGKPATKTTGADGRIHFYRHQDVGAELAAKLLDRLKFSNSNLDKIVHFVALHMRIGEYKPTEWTDAAVRRFVRDASTQLDELFFLHAADVSALAGDHQDMTRAQELRDRIDHLETAQPSREIDSPLTGEEIIDTLGIAPGRKVGEYKQWLIDEVIEGRLRTGDKETAIAALKHKAGL